jgi:DNA-binding GntR family transcriptional regulator
MRMTVVDAAAGVERARSRARSGASIAAVSVADAATEHLRSLLFSGALHAGQELRDTVLAQQLGIARPTARIAVQRLVADGLLEREPGQSARVRTFAAEDIADVYRVRRLIEFEAVRRIIADQRSTAPIERALEAFRAAGDEWSAGPDADTAFHSAVVDAAGSPRLSRLFSSIAAESRLLIALLRSRYAALSELYDEHAALLRALKAADEESALELWSNHIADAERFLSDSAAEVS